MQVEHLFTVPCQKCANETVGRQYGFSDEGAWYVLYMCPSCGNLDWFSLSAEEVIALVIKAKPTPVRGMDNGYL